MKQFLSGILLSILVSSCQSKQEPVVDPQVIDHWMQAYNGDQALRANQTEINFWKDRIVPGSEGITNESRYAAELKNRFQLTGNIHYLQQADSILWAIIQRYNGREASPFLSLAYNAIMEHRFTAADTLLEKAKAIGIKPFDAYVLGFDVNFELGRYDYAREQLKRIRDDKDYSYQFRRGKMAHYDGELDSAVGAMDLAAKLVPDSKPLQQAALTNEADLYLHSGKMKEAAALYQSSLQLNAADLHSLSGLGWIALMHDGQDSLAAKVFTFVQQHTLSPDATWKLEQLAEYRKDSILQTRYARAFEAETSKPAYGNMYNKYLIQLYTGILHDPAKALLITDRELLNRNTPQTNAWHAYALLMNDQPDIAYTVFKQKVSGKPLEGLELYWMGKLMQRLGKGYNAAEYFKLAKKNRYDLAPGMLRDLESL